MNKRQKKKQYKKLHGHNPPKQKRKRKYKPGAYAREVETQIYPCIKPETRKRISEVMISLSETMQKAFARAMISIKADVERMREVMKSLLPLAEGERLDRFAEIYGISRKPYESDNTLRRRILGEKEPPRIVVAKALTRQRAAGKRKKYHTRNRRKRKWH